MLLRGLNTGTDEVQLATAVLDQAQRRDEVQLATGVLDQVQGRDEVQLTVRQSPAPLVTVATSDTIPGTVNPKAMASTGTSAIAVSVHDDNSAISSRSRQKGLQYAVEGYIQNIKINNEGDTTIIEAKAHRSQSKKLETPRPLH